MLVYGSTVANDLEEDTLALLNSDPGNPITASQPLDSSRNIHILQDVQVAPPNNIQNESPKDSETETAHTCNAENNFNDGIPILDEIINNKVTQVIVSKNPHNQTDVKQETFDNHKILYVKIPNSASAINEFLREYTSNDRTFYLYFHEDSLYTMFNRVFIDNFDSNELKLVKCTKLINTVKEKDEQLMLIKFQHEGKSNHRGINETLEKLKRNYYWPRMKSDITHFINDCVICQKAKYSRNPPYIPLVLTESIGKPFQLLHADVFTFNSQHFLTIIDAFSKLGQAVPIQAKTSVEICRAFLHYFSYYGLPERITLDNGTEFKNETVRELLKCHKIDVHFTTPLHHESNSPIERFHSSLIEHLRILLQKFPKETTTNLINYALIAYNSSLHSATKFTPFELTFGHTISRDPSDLIETTFYSDYASNHKDKMKHLYQRISNDLQENKAKVLEKRNIHGSSQYQFKVGQVVYKANRRRNKKDNKFKGPFELVEILEHNKAKIKNKSTNKIEIIHMKELKVPSISGSSPAAEDRQQN
ncbi:unnamed protein product [Acanthoscelides obtectus]|uniref:RNA-directed DNA polymerase n=1 Tax=Acanthoscelides obtectus TaxID=200917 RepID=A0A9P0M665_ACAOB|nr:unnamed protein product [Acanthoscelides obtectus]CAK1677436.1 Retrovirus-related Pol polyprotein from transposon gypsy [Acanthoscelides obtectus]